MSLTPSLNGLKSLSRILKICSALNSEFLFNSLTKSAPQFHGPPFLCGVITKINFFCDSFIYDIYYITNKKMRQPANLAFISQI